MGVVGGCQPRDGLRRARVSRVAGWLHAGGERRHALASSRCTLCQKRAENPVISSEVRCSCSCVKYNKYP